MAIFSAPQVLQRTRLYHWWLKIRYISARTPNFRPLLRAEFSGNDPFVQADFLFRAGYHNAAICMSRFAVEKRLRRLAMISPDWKTYRCKTSGATLAFLYRAKVLRKREFNKIENYSKRANKYVHETFVEKHVAGKILLEGENLRPLLDAITSVMLAS